MVSNPFIHVTDCFGKVHTVDKAAFIRRARETMSDFNEPLLSNAWDFAFDAHADQQWITREAYFTHPVRVGYLLFDVGPDSATVAIALLHALIEEAKTDFEELNRQFGPALATMISSVTKLSPLDHAPDHPWVKESQRTQSLRRLFASIVNDPRVALVKLADRLDTLRSGDFIPQDKRRWLSEESLDVFAPIAEALGLVPIQSAIQDQAFRYLEPQQYQDLEKQITLRRPEFNTVEQVAMELIEDSLSKMGISAIVMGRQKEPYSIYRKMKATELSFEEVYDIIGIRIIVDTEEACYAAKKAVDELGIEFKYDDYISRPRGVLGYQSLHKVVLDAPRGRLIEVQIRTRSMHDRAEKGDAAHWIYKIGKSGNDSELASRLHQLRNALENRRDPSIEKDELTTEDLIKVMGKVTPETIQVLTPKGDIVSLPLGATPLDFAYLIHSVLGDECREARVNGDPVPLDYQLRNGDSVEILRLRGAKPREEWISEGKVETGRAKRAIQRHVNIKEQDYFMDFGRARLANWLSGMSRFKIHARDVAAVLLEEHELSNGAETDLYLAIGTGRVSRRKLANIIGKLVLDRLLSRPIQDDELAAVLNSAVNSGIITSLAPVALYAAIAQGLVSLDYLKATIKEARTKGILLKTVTKPQYYQNRLSNKSLGGTYLAKCCRPVLGDPIVGYVTLGRGLAVHHLNCRMIPELSKKGRIISVEWNSLVLRQEDATTGELVISVHEVNDVLLHKLEQVLAQAGATLLSLHQTGLQKSGLAELQVSIEVRNADHLLHIQNWLWSVDDIISVRRMILT